ncbi:MAG: ABC transporter permease [Actinomycetota bacterium]|nr:ABC transporter permease [Actinomycetota bacterium]
MLQAETIELKDDIDSNRGAKGSFDVRSLVRWESGLGIVLIASLIIGTVASPQFLTSANFFNIGLSVGDIAIMALPLTLIVISGEIDLSVASILGLSSSLLGFLWIHGWPIQLIIPVVLIDGAILGFINGFLVTKLGLPSLAVTIGTLTLYRGIALILLGSNIVSNFPASYTTIGVNPIPGTPLPWSVGIFLILALIFGVVAHFTPLGRSIFAIGSNSEAAAYSGIKVKQIKMRLYILSGVVCSLAGILFTFRLATAEYDNATGLELNAVSIVLLAGVSIFGGRGTIIGVVLAAATVGAIGNALLLANFPQQAMGLINGGLLLISVFVPNARELFGRLRGHYARRRLVGLRRG